MTGIVRFHGISTGDDRATQRLMNLPGRLFTVSGPSGVGKGTIIQGLFKTYGHTGQIDQVRSLTTRGPRPGEVPNFWGRVAYKLKACLTLLGVPTGSIPWLAQAKAPQYTFVKTPYFEALKNKDELFQWALYDGNYYGSKLEDVIRRLKRGINVVFELASKDALDIKRKLGQAVTTVFIAPPKTTITDPPDASSLDQQLLTLKNRLIGRGTNSPESIEKRLNQAKNELALQDGFDHVIVNEDNQQAQAVEALHQIIQNPQPRFGDRSLSRPPQSFAKKVSLCLS